MSKRKSETTAALAAPMTNQQTSEQMQAKLTGLREKMEDSWPGDAKYQKLAAEVADLERQLRIAEVNEVQPSAPMSLRFEERPIAIATIVITGNHREEDDEPATIALANSLKTHNLQQRIGVRAMWDGRFELIFGSRRLAAAKLAGWELIPAKVYQADLTPAQVEILRSIENFGRKNLTPVEEAVAIARTIDAIQATLDRPGKMTAPDLKGVPHARAETLAMAYEEQFDEATGQAKELQQQIDAAGGLYAYVGQQFSRKADWVRDHAYVSKLGGESRKLLMARRIDIGHARELAKLGDPAAADRVADEAARDERGLGGKDVAYVKRRVTEHLKSLRVVPWQLDVAFGGRVKGCTGHACVTCPHNSKTDPDLFGGSITDEPEAGVCTNETCFRTKTEIVEKDMAAVVKKAKPVVKNAGGTITQVTIGGLIPRHIKPTSGVRMLQKELGDKPAASGKTSRGTSEPKAAKDPGWDARGAYADARDAWSEKTADAIVKAIKGKPLAVLAVNLLLENRVRQHGGSHPHWSPYLYGKDQERQKLDTEKEYTAALAKSNKVADELAPLFARVASPDLALIQELAKDGQIDKWSFSQTADRLLIELAKALGVSITPPPDRDAMIAKAEGKQAPEPAGKTLEPFVAGFEDLPIHYAAQLKTTLAAIEDADQLAAMQEFKGARPKAKAIDLLNQDWIVLGTTLIRGVECWQLAQLGSETETDLVFSDALSAADAGRWDGISVQVGKHHRRIYADPAANPPTLIFVNAVVEDGGNQA